MEETISFVLSFLVPGLVTNVRITLHLKIFVESSGIFNLFQSKFCSFFFTNLSFNYHFQ